MIKPVYVDLGSLYGTNLSSLLGKGEGKDERVGACVCVCVDKNSMLNLVLSHLQRYKGKFRRTKGAR